MATTSDVRYFRHSPRGFGNEIHVYMVATAIAEDWATEFERGLSDDSADRFDEIDASEAASLTTAAWNTFGHAQDIR